MKELLIAGLLLVLATLGFSQPDRHPDEFADSREGVEEMLAYLLTASRKERAMFTEELRPTKEECELLFEPAVAKKVYRYQRRLQRQTRIVVQPLLKSQTELLIWAASSAELSSYQGEARFFPGGYHELAEFLKPGFVFYRFKFIQPGRKLGSAYDVLVHVNGHWRLIHRPWTVLVE
ncbi:MAG: hypothetical protein AAF399_25710 [Bacteroidota bacterium]